MALNREGRKAIPIPDDIKNFIGDLVIKGEGYGYIRKKVLMEYGVLYSVSKLNYNNVKTFNVKDSKIREKQFTKLELTKYKNDFYTKNNRKIRLAYVDLSDLTTKSNRKANKKARRFTIGKKGLKIGIITNGVKTVVKTWINGSSGEFKEYFTQLVEAGFLYGIECDAIILDSNADLGDYHKPIIRIKKGQANPYNQVIEHLFAIKDQIYPMMPYLKTLKIEEVKAFTDDKFKVYLFNGSTVINPISVDQKLIE